MFYRPEPRNDLWIESLGKSITLITTASLALGFFYDIALFSLLDTKLWGILVLADHIETSILAVPLVISVSFAMIGLIWLMNDKSYQSTRRIVRIPVLIFGFVVAIFLPLNSFTDLPMWFSAALTAYALVVSFQ